MAARKMQNESRYNGMYNKGHIITAMKYCNEIVVTRERKWIKSLSMCQDVMDMNGHS